MKKTLLILTGFIFLLAACNNTVTKKENQKTDEKLVVVDEVVPVTVSEFEAKAGDLVGKKVKISGTVDHVCKHGGQKMFLIETGSDNRVKITPDEHVAAFKPDWEGQNIVVTGIVEEQRIDEDFLKEWEEEIKSGENMGDDKGEGKHMGGNMEKGEEEADMSQEMKKINNLRQQIKNSGKDYISFYSVTCTDYNLTTPSDTTGEEKE